MKLRFFAADPKSNAGLPGCVVRICLELKFSTPSSTDSVLETDLAPDREVDDGTASGLPPIVLATTRTDHCGYGVIDLSERRAIESSILNTLLSGTGNNVVDLYLDIDGSVGSRESLLSGTLIEALRRRANTTNLPDNTSSTDNPAGRFFELLGERTDAIMLVADDQAKLGPAGHVANPDATDYRLSPDSFVSRRPVRTGDDGCEHLTPATLPLRQYPIYHIVVHDMGDKEGLGKDLPSVNRPPRMDSRILWGRILEFEQSWMSLGHSLGEVKYSLALAPGEAVKIAVIDWKRDDTGSRTAANASKDDLLHDQTVDRDIDDIVSGRVAEKQSGESFMAGLAGAADFTLPQIGLSAAGRHSIGYGMSNTQGKRDVSADAHQDVHLKTLQRSNLARSQNSSVIVQATQAESNFLSTRIVANMNRGHSLSVLYYEVLRHLAVRTEFRRADPAILVPVDMFAFDAGLARRFRAQLEPVLLDEKLRPGFDALERLALGSIAGSGNASTPAPTPAPATTPEHSPIATQFEIELVSEWRYSTLLSRYVPPADTAGAIRIVAELMDGTEVPLVELQDRAPVLEQFGDINNWIARWPGWRISFEDKDQATQRWGRTIAVYSQQSKTIDLRSLKQITVKWKRVQTIIPFASESDGWNLKRIAIKAITGDGATYQLVDHTYVLGSAQKELFSPTTSNDFFDNRQAKLLPISFAATTPTGTQPPSPPASNTGSTALPAGTDSELALLLVNHLNANQYYYNANVWLLMDSRERRRRIAGYVGSLIAGMSDVPLAMSGNHLAFRYSTVALPAAAREVLPDAGPGLPAREDVITLPTRGIFAEAHLGHCNAAEKRDITRFWNFDELPVSLLPNIDTLTAGPRGAIPGLTPDTMGSSPLGIQATPGLPAPGEAIAKALELLGKPDIFRDMSAREEVAGIMAKLIESAQPPKLSGDNIGSAIFPQSKAPGSKDAGGSGTSRGTGDPNEWANPFPDRSSEISDGQSFLAEKFGNTRLTDQYDAFSLGDDLANFAKTTGMSNTSKNDLADKVSKGTSTRVSRTTAPRTLKQRFSIGLKSRSIFTGGVERALNGNITLDISPAGDMRSMMPISYLIPVNGGVGRQMVSLEAGQYTANVSYAPAKIEDLKFLREPQLESVGVNGEELIRGVFDLMQRDFATDWQINAEVEGELFEVPEKCKGLAFKLVAEMEQNQALAFEAELGLDEGFTVASDATVSFDTSKLADLATKIAATLKFEQAGMVAALLSLFTFKSSIGIDGKNTIAGSQKIKISFKPAILKRFTLTAIK